MNVRFKSKRLTQLLHAFLTAALFLVLHPFAVAADSEAGAFFIQQYGPKTYGESPQNWSAVQDRRGVMFFGNTNGVLEFDGATWRTISINGLGALALATDSKGTVFVGSQNDFGFLKPDANGALQFVSLAARIPAAHRNLGNVRRVDFAQSAVWFTTKDVLYRWRPDTGDLSAIPAPGISRSFAIGNELYVHSRSSGLSVVHGNALEPVHAADSVPRDSIWSIARFHGTIVIATRDGLYREEGSRFVSWRTADAGLFRDAGLYFALALSNGKLALATVRRGLLVLNEDGTLDRAVDARSGLRSDTVRSVFEDRQRGVWLTLARGLARVEAEIPLTSFGEREGIGEPVYAITRFQDRLYAGTALGVSYLDAALPGQVPHFTRVDGIGDTVISLCSVRNELIAAVPGSLYAISEGRCREIPKTQGIVDMGLSARDPAVLYAISASGLQVLRRSATEWTVLKQLKAIDRDLRTVVESTDGSLWITARSAIHRVDWKQQPALIESYGGAAGVPEGWVNAYQIQGRVLFATTRGLLKFDESSKRFVPDYAFGKAAADGSHQVSWISEAANGDVWISGAGYQALLTKVLNGAYRWIDTPLARAGIGELYGIHLDTDGTAWASGSDVGLVRYAAHRQQSDGVPSLLLRQVESLKSKRMVSNGESSGAAPMAFPFSDNALRFEFAMPDFEDPSTTRYQVWLKGLDREWSNWSKETEKEYTNLYEKTYTLQVRARNLHGELTAPAQFSFRIRPPWYRTWWSFILYFACALGAVAFIIRLRLSQLAARNRRLEAIIAARTSKIRDQRDQILAKEKETNALLLNILPPQVAEELRTTGKVEPVSCSDVAICFTDFVGFTLSSETMSAQKLVAALHTYFVAFDEVISRYGLEKLKTIGDAYMFVGGLPDAKTSFAVDTVLAAMELVHIVERFYTTEPGVGWKVRVGVNCGSAIAGVVGSKKFAFDIWGNSVNLASRMESSGQANHVNISSDTYPLVKDFIDCEPRGLVKTKEGRYLEMYFARRIKPELLMDENGFDALYRERFEKTPPLIDIVLRSAQASSQVV